VDYYNMKGGTLSNEVSPRHVIVFEGGIAVLPVQKRAEFDKEVSKDRWWKAIRLFEYRTSVINQIERVIRTMNANIEVCTWMGEDAALAIEDELDDLHVPVRSVWASTPFELAKALAYLPDIAAIYDPDPDHVLTYGSRGVLLTEARQIGRGRELS
jgi:hypothetical protein